MVHMVADGAVELRTEISFILQAWTCQQSLGLNIEADQRKVLPMVVTVNCKKQGFSKV